MTTDEQYVPDEEQVRAWCREGTGDYPDVMDGWLDRFLARVRRDAALHEKQRIAGEVRLWASVTDSQNEPEQAASLRAVADDIDRIPEETP